MPHPYRVRLEAFEGPLDLLLQLIKEHRVDIHAIPVARIAWEYLDHLAGADQLDLEDAAEFLLMASTLMEIKARMLLPVAPAAPGVEVGEADPRRDLIERLLEYRSLRRAAEALGVREAEAGRRFSRPLAPEFYGPETGVMEPLPVTDLAAAMAALLRRNRPEQPRTIPREGFSIGEKMRLIARTLRRRTGERVLFWTLVRTGSGRREIIVTFLALLELLRLGWADARQERCFGRILVGRRGR
ncbi:MAG TPA: segregation/condensation protein A [Bacillota bacterium]|nr:segregation/condensation protein A [Bacillota bacterium]